MREIGEHTHSLFVQFVDLILFHLFIMHFPLPFMFVVLVTDNTDDDERDKADVQ